MDKIETKYVVVHAGRRDNYEVAVALHQNNMLSCLVTDYYSPLDNPIFYKIVNYFGLFNLFNKRYNNELPSAKVVLGKKALLISVFMVLFKKNKWNNLKDKYLGVLANEISHKNKCSVLSMNTYAMYAFKNIENGKKVLFQFHPQPSFVKSEFLNEIERFPESRNSLSKEYELTLSDDDVHRLDMEAHEANLVLVASNFTKESLVSTGVHPDKIKVISYGVNLNQFKYVERTPSTSQMNILFLGSLNQRKGIIYLLESLNSLKSTQIHLSIVGRGIFDKTILDNYQDVNLSIYENVSHSQLCKIIENSDVFVLPSIIEGFGQVILEAMSSGLVIICTKFSAGPDIIEDGIDGFVIDPRNIDEISKRIMDLYHNPDKRILMGNLANQKVRKCYTWANFRLGLINELKSFENKKLSEC